MRAGIACVVCAWAAVGCSVDPLGRFVGADPATDAGRDAGPEGIDAAPVDAGLPDAGSEDVPPVRTTLRPSNLRGASVDELTAGTSEMVIGAEAREWWTLDSDTGAIDAHDFASGAARTVRDPGMGLGAGWGFAIVTQGDGSELGVLSVARLEIVAGSELYPVGSRPLAIVVGGDAMIGGLISSASRRYDGLTIWIAAGGRPGGGSRGDPGAGTGGGSGGAGGMLTDEGGGGASFGTVGGVGSGGAAAGAPYGEASLQPLAGGSGGGGGGDDDGGGGGAGGGGIQLSAGGSIVVVAGGIVEAGGAGGSGGRTTETIIDSGAGGGGGSGGAILLEAKTVTLDGIATANGGAGGDGAACDLCMEAGANGADAPRSLDSAPASSAITGGGGAGSDALGMAGAGNPGHDGGGGGGGAGRIRINTARGTDTFTNVSPSAASGAMTVGVAEIR